MTTSSSRRRGTVSVALVRPLVAALAGRPEALDAFFRATDLTPERLADPELRVTPATFRVAWSEATRLTAAPTLALVLAAAIPAGAFGVVEYLCRAAPTLADGLRQWVRYLNLLDDAVEVGLRVGDETGALVVIAESEAPAPASHELCFALVHSHVLAITSPAVKPLRVQFTHTVADPTPYAEWFGVRPEFGAERCAMTWRASELAAPLVTSDAALAQILARHAEWLETQRPKDPPLTAQVRRLLVRALEQGDTAIDAVGRQLGMSGRTLQRRLEDEGTTFIALRDGLRRDLATRYLEEAVPMAEIAFRLGFSEPSAFFRAFRRWTGETPGGHRAGRRALSAA